MSAEGADALRFERWLAHPPERVFAAFTTAEAVSDWLSPSPEIAPLVECWHLASEGEYRIAYAMPGEAHHVLTGRFLRVDPPHSLSMTWQWQEPDEHAGIETHVAITITAEGAGSLLLIEHRRLTGAAMPERHSAGWAGALDRLATFLDHPERELHP